MINFRRIMVSIIAALTSIMTIIGVAGCGSSSASEDPTDVTFMLYWTPDTNHIGVYVAQNLGYYKDAGLNVNIVAVSQTGGETAVDTGVADFALSTMTILSQYDAKTHGDLKMVMQVQQKPSSIWCALKSNASIKSPKDFDGKTFATAGSSESDAVVKRMIQNDGGKGVFDKVTAGTNTFQTLTSGRADFGGFYATWEGVQAQLHGPALNCFTEPDYGIPGNADSIGVITSEKMIKNHPQTVKKFVQATQKGYQYAYDHPDDASEILVKEAPDANLELDMVKKSMHTIIDGDYWGDANKIADGTFTIGTVDTTQTQRYFDFLSDTSDTYVDANGNKLKEAPKAADMSTNEFVKQ
ncbi:ABC transporter substrate-binding protein [Bifidobacterium magnum]|uniref:Thiamine pyrimidine synthase n=1 Tax=Bifidobacterium magnum TaxID=1692 RepID=A0A087BDS5_9BIFI|nr:ABC transporter, hydroxymethylpyrimidine solute-binding protein [Bifidobacterium magnum]